MRRNVIRENVIYIGEINFWVNRDLRNCNSGKCNLGRCFSGMMVWREMTLRGPASSAGVGLSSLCGFLFVFVNCTCIIVVKAFF
jgi:hypothetical protein